MNSNYDYEVCSFNKQLGSFSSASTDLMSFSGRRSVQECTDSVFNAVNTTQLVNYLKELRTPTEDFHVQSAKVVKKVGFTDHVSEQIVQSTDLLDENESYDDEPSTENERATVHFNEPTIELKIEEHKTTIIDITNIGGKQLPPSNIPNAVPKEWTSLMCRALTTASDQPYKITEVPESNIEDCNVNGCGNECQNICPNRDVCQQNYTANVEQRLTSFVTCDQSQAVFTNSETHERKRSFETEEKQSNCCVTECDSACTNATLCQQDYSSEFNQESSVTETSATTNYFDAVASDQTYKGSYLTSALTVASPNPLQWTKPEVDEDVPLPEESAPYVPPPVSKARIQRISHIGTKSPFLQALTTAPIKSYTPFEHDVISQLEDLPTPSQKLNLLDALTVAPDEPIHEFKPELPAETEAEKVARLEHERQEVQAKEVDNIITNTIDLELSKNFSAFAPFKGFRSVQPFKPLPSRDQIDPLTSNHESINGSQSELVNGTTTTTHTGAYQSQSDSNESQHDIACSKDNSNRYSNKKTVAFPPPTGTAARSFVQSGLQSPKTIPKYQRQWFNLASQSPIKTPEPQELKDNVPLAFVEVPHETSDTVSKPLAVTISVTPNEPTETVSRRSSITSLVSEVKETRQSSSKSTVNLQIVEPVVHRPPTPTSIHKPTILPPYQQHSHLVCENFPATASHVFEPNIRCPSPRAKSPALGPPPNPLKIQAPRLKSPEPLNNQPISIVPSIVTGQSGLKVQTFPFTSDSAQITSAFQSSNYAAQQSFIQKPETVQREQIGSTSIETRSQASQFNDAKKLDVQSSSTVQIGNTQVQRNRRVVEEFERSQSSKTVEVYKSSGGDAAALLINRSSLKATQDDDSEPGDSYSKGFVARQARRLSENNVCKSKLPTYHTSFPENSSPVPSTSLFPVKQERKVCDEPKEQSYHQTRPSSKLGVAPIPLPGYQQVVVPSANAAPSPTTNKKLTNESFPPTKLTKTSVAVLPTAASALPAIDTILTTSNAYTSTQTTTASKSTSVSVPSFKLTNKNQSAVSDPSPASAGPNKGSSFGATSAPKRGRGVLNKSVAPGARVPQCGSCFTQIRWWFLFLVDEFARWCCTPSSVSTMYLCTARTILSGRSMSCSPMHVAWNNLPILFSWSLIYQNKLGLIKCK